MKIHIVLSQPEVDAVGKKVGKREVGSFSHDPAHKLSSTCVYKNMPIIERERDRLI